MFNKETGKYEGYIYKVDGPVGKSYIGQTSRTVKERWMQHKKEARHNYDNFYFHASMRKYGIENFKIYTLGEYCADTWNQLKEILNEKQVYYIKEYGTLCPNGYNLTPGGNSTLIYMSKAVDCYDIYQNKIGSFDSMEEAYDFLGIKHTGIISKVCDGELETYKGYVWRYKGHPYNEFEVNTTEEDLKDKVRCPVDQYSLDGKYVASYVSLKDAANSLKGVAYYSQIKKCCMGIIDSYFNFVWRFSGHPFSEKMLIPPKCKTETATSYMVDKYKKDGTFICTYNNSIEAARSFNILGNLYARAAAIRRCCDGKIITYQNFIWRKHGEPFEKYKIKDIRVGNSKNRKVDQYSLDDKYISTFNTARDAAEAMNVDADRIRACCREEQHTYAGYKWIYHGGVLTKSKNLNGSKRKINQYTSDRKFVRTFDKIQDICDEFGKNIRSSIQRCVQKQQDSYRGFLWYYANDPDQPDATKIILN